MNMIACSVIRSIMLETAASKGAKCTGSSHDCAACLRIDKVPALEGCARDISFCSQMDDAGTPVVNAHLNCGCAIWSAGKAHTQIFDTKLRGKRGPEFFIGGPDSALTSQCTICTAIRRLSAGYAFGRFFMCL